MSGASRKMGFNATWSMAVGGMVGGGIFSVLGLVVSVAGAWAWASLLLAGLVALATGWSYSSLARRYGESGGAFTFLREAGRDWLAGSLSWMLIGGYVLTIAVYAFTFGHYLGAVTPLGAIGVRVAAVAIVLALLGVNLIGVGEASWLEIVTVWGKLAVLLALAVVGLWTLDVPNLSYDDATPGGGLGIVVGAASIFMAYEGFQLLTYDYDDMRRAKRTLPLAIMTAIGAVIVVYVLVAVGSASLTSAMSAPRRSPIGHDTCWTQRRDCRNRRRCSSNPVDRSSPPQQ